METIVEILEKLSRPISPSLFQVKKKGGAKIDYVAWYDLVDLLDEYAPGWEYKVEPQCYPHHWIQIKKIDNKPTEIERHGLMIVCKASITIHGSDGSVTRESIGYQDPEEAYIGDEATNVEATALRRTCAKLGLGRDMWRKGKKPQRSNNTKRQNTQRNNAQPQQRQEPQLTPDQMVSMVRTMLDNSYQKGGKALQEAIKKANTKLSKFPRENRPAVMEMIQGYTERLAEFEVTG